MIVSQIVAIAKNRVMGVNNTLPWHLPEDMKFFREKTKGHIMIMGRKTYESLGKPLPNRFHIVISRNENLKYDHPMVKVTTSLTQALEVAESLIPQWPNEIFIIGGSDIFKDSFKNSNTIYLTMIEKEFQGDTFYPEIPINQFKMTQKKFINGPLPFSFTTWERIN